MTTKKHGKRTSKKAKRSRDVRRDHTFHDLLRKGKGAGSTGPRKQKD